jgi:methylenetetrahydrofolate reductase (NADPH)
MVPVPHITARSIPSAEVLDRRLGELASEAGVKGALAIAGGDHESAGPFADTISMLETGLFQKHGIRAIGFAGHPEGLPGIERAQMREHAHRKIDFAKAVGIDMYIVTQFVFEAQPLFDFMGRIRAAGNDLPVIVGLPGLATIQTLIRHAQACGIGASMQFLLNRAKDLRKLLTVQAPDRLLVDIVRYRLENPDCGITGVHMFPLGGFDRTASWANAVAAGEFELLQDGFSVRDRD